MTPKRSALPQPHTSPGAHSPLHILHVIPTLSLGGTERHLVDFIRSSDPRRLQHTVCVLYEPETLLPVLKDYACHVVALRLEGKHPWARAAARIHRLCQIYKPDVMQTWLYDAGISARLAALLSRHVPVVSGLQAAAYDPVVVHLQHWPPRKVEILRRIDRFTAWASRTYFVSISQFVLDSSIEHGGFPRRRMLGVIPNAINLLPPESGADGLRPLLGLTNDQFVVLNVGRLDEGKGQETLIRAFARSFAGQPDVRLVIFGEGPLRNHLDRLAGDLGIAPQVLLPGAQADIASVYAAADLFVFPSIHEGLGMALLEAMAAGLPCIASDIPPLREILEDGSCGVLVHPGDVEGMADVLRTVGGDAGQRESLARLAIKRASDFSFERTLPIWEQTYRTVCRSRTAAR